MNDVDDVVAVLWPELKLNAGGAEVVVVVIVVPAGIGSCGALLDPNVKVVPVVGGAEGDALLLLGFAMSGGEVVGGAACALAPKDKAG